MAIYPALRKGRKQPFTLIFTHGVNLINFFKRDTDTSCNITVFKTGA